MNPLLRVLKRQLTQTKHLSYYSMAYCLLMTGAVLVALVSWLFAQLGTGH